MYKSNNALISLMLIFLCGLISIYLQSYPVIAATNSRIANLKKDFDFFSEFKLSQPQSSTIKASPPLLDEGITDQKRPTKIVSNVNQDVIGSGEITADKPNNWWSFDSNSHTLTLKKNTKIDLNLTAADINEYGKFPDGSPGDINKEGIVGQYPGTQIGGTNCWPWGKYDWATHKKAADGQLIEDNFSHNIHHIKIEPNVQVTGGTLNGIFAWLPELEDIQGLANLKTETVTNFGGIFCGDQKLKRIDFTDGQNDSLPTWQLTQATTISWMFYGCQNLTQIVGVTAWQTAKIQKAAGLFGQCEKLSFTDELNSWQLANLQDSSWMFYDCLLINELTGVKAWDLSQDENLYGMFAQCQSLTKVDTSNWQLQRATNVSKMFQGCSKLLQVVASGAWKLSEVTNNANMFNDCSSLESLDVSNWNLSNLVDSNRAFFGCSKLNDLQGSGQLKLLKVTNTREMFSDCRALPKLDVSNWQLSNLNDTSFMFFDCKNLTELIGNDKLRLDSLTTAEAMFVYCTNINNLSLDKWNLTKLKIARAMFQGCEKLTSVDLGNTSLSADHTSTSDIFTDTKRLSRLVLGPHTKLNSAAGLGPAANDLRGFPNADSLKITRSKNWQEVGSGSEDDPQGPVLTAQEIIAKYNDSQIAHTFIWQPFNRRGPVLKAVPTQLDYGSYSIYKAGLLKTKAEQTFAIEDTRLAKDRTPWTLRVSASHLKTSTGMELPQDLLLYQGQKLGSVPATIYARSQPAADKDDSGRTRINYDWTWKPEVGIKLQLSANSAQRLGKYSCVLSYSFYSSPIVVSNDYD
ncbi:BspA family leucine-rich repeat surface protein [Lactobacillus sp. DCY120]|uniref:BspA family leucine-rich repeat surface protein n=1 Tax=Bombilactobacillus apium TaxID=2675299 RepID=A0A850R2E7_9LACO|nr:BspA family leucine-rich repeat surface protein [Bombilactobacillus apium]NVY96191.1 BspA family leucine-rich repeat surface protein [Bombilactobacillus apium]